ncbi:Alpha/Beta hydrolase protein [Chytridium lagenaria]|nr:Alpha/Beta hydrolase protein [Chytridium lagenaria]
MEGIDTSDPRFITVKESFESPSSRIILHLRILKRNPNLDVASVPDVPRRTTRRIAVAITGDPTGIPMFVHGGMRGSRLLAWMLHDLGVHYGIKIIVPDRPGVGLSEPWDIDTFPNPSTYPLLTSTTLTPYRGSFLDWADYVPLIADQLHIPRFAMLGLSCGCIYSLAVALKHPDRLLPIPLQFFGCWVPPSESGCSMTVKSAGTLLPTSSIINMLAVGDRLAMDPVNYGVTRGVAKTISFFTWFSGSSSGSFELNPKPVQRVEVPGEERVEDDGEVMPMESLGRNPVECRVICDASGSRSSPKEAETMTLKLVGAVSNKPSNDLISNDSVDSSESHPRRPTSRTTITSSSTTATIPSWSHTDISSELPFLLPMPYNTIGAIDDFLHCLTRTPLGFQFSDITHPITSRHGKNDMLVPLSSAQSVAAAYGWTLEVLDGEGHDIGRRGIELGFKDVAWEGRLLESLG